MGQVSPVRAFAATPNAGATAPVHLSGAMTEGAPLAALLLSAWMR